MCAKRNSRQRGFTLIELLIVICVVAVLSAIAVPSVMASRRCANEASAISTLRLLASAEESYRARHTPASFGTLENLSAANLVDAVLASGHKSGYTFAQVGAPGTNEYTFTATPDFGAGSRYFYLDQSGVIRAKDGAPASASSTPVE